MRWHEQRVATQPNQACSSVWDSCLPLPPHLDPARMAASGLGWAGLGCQLHWPLPHHLSAHQPPWEKEAVEMPAGIGPVASQGSAELL